MAEGDAAAKPDLKVITDSDTAASEADAAMPPNETASEVAAAPAQAEMPFAVDDLEHWPHQNPQPTRNQK